MKSILDRRTERSKVLLCVSGITVEFFLPGETSLIGLPPSASHSELSVAALDCDQTCIEPGIFVMTIFLFPFFPSWESLGFPNREELWKAARAARMTLHIGSTLFLSLFRAHDGRFKKNVYWKGKVHGYERDGLQKERAQDWHVFRLCSISVSPCFCFPLPSTTTDRTRGEVFVTCHYIDLGFFWLSSLGGCLV